MERKSLLLLALVALAAQVHGCAHVYTRRELIAELKAEGAHWDHESGGLDWTGTCAEGKVQSPINLRHSQTAGNLADSLKAKTKFGIVNNPRVVNTGHAVQMEWDSETGLDASLPVLGDSIYNLYNVAKPNSASNVQRYALKPLQFHMHTTSEHLLNGQDADIELHIVNQLVAAPGQTLPKECQAPGSRCLAVFGILFTVKPNAGPNGDPMIETLLSNAPIKAGAADAKNLTGTFSLDALLPESKDYYAYVGSLTTPPCSEGVMWHVFKQKKRTLSASQVVRLQALQAKTEISIPCNDGGAGECWEPNHDRLNSRTIQDLNSRKVYNA